jgi:epoxide hydrolase-like predicted phosphatase
MGGAPEARRGIGRAMAIKALVFDCGGVLLRNGDLSPYRRWEERLGLAEGELERHLWAGDLWRQAERGEISDAEFWRRAAHGLGLGEETTTKLRADIWETWEVEPRVLALIDQARARYRVAMLTNATDAMEELLTEHYGVADRFEAIVNSARVGVAKPDAAIYQELLRRLALSAGEVVLIDDRAENVAAAAALGMHVAWFLGAAELERQLDPYLNPAARAPEAEQS